MSRQRGLIKSGGALGLISHRFDSDPAFSRIKIFLRRIPVQLKFMLIREVLVARNPFDTGLPHHLALEYKKMLSASLLFSFLKRKMLYLDMRLRCLLLIRGLVQPLLTVCQKSECWRSTIALE